MIGKRVLVVGGLVAALAVPTGVAVAATTSSPSPSPSGSSTQPAGPGYGYGRMAGGHGDPEDCPYYNSPEAQAWRDGRAARQELSPADRQKLVQQHREQMWQLRSGTTSS